MRALHSVGQRLATSDSAQLLTLLLAAMLFALLVSWPGGADPVNDSWFIVAQVRAAALALLGLAYGVRDAGAPRRQRLVSLAALACFAFLALPVELAAFAASYPALPLAWPLVAAPLDAAAAYAWGAGCGELLRLSRLRFLTPLAVPALLAGFVAADLALGRLALNPIAGAVNFSMLHLVSSALAVALLALLGLRPSRGSG